MFKSSNATIQLSAITYMLSHESLLEKKDENEIFLEQAVVETAPAFIKQNMTWLPLCFYN